MAALQYTRFLSFFHLKISIKFKYYPILKILVDIISKLYWQHFGRNFSSLKIQDGCHAGDFKNN
jgi:hypothetical protein